MALNLKQKLFVREFVKDLNATQAYIRAGYSENGAGQSASTLLQNPEIQMYLRQRIELAESVAEIDDEYVLQGIKSVTERCLVPQPKFLNKDGDPVGETFEAHGALKGYELLGKYRKLFTDKTESTVTGAVQLITTVPRPEREPKA